MPRKKSLTKTLKKSHLGRDLQTFGHALKVVGSGAKRVAKSKELRALGQDIKSTGSRVQKTVESKRFKGAVQQLYRGSMNTIGANTVYTPQNLTPPNLNPTENMRFMLTGISPSRKKSKKKRKVKK